ncbi:MAG: hypothetical protein L0170_06170, partial [Acidobacteria bacterium]|nr:hypothetical protein [Acidobacteriota bacterium]
MRRAAKLTPSQSLNASAEAYVRLALALGEHDPDSVDAYYGPKNWREEAKAQKKPLPAIAREAFHLMSTLNALDLDREKAMVKLRRSYLVHQLKALATKSELLQGKKLTFDQESKALYDAVAPTYSDAHFLEVLDRLEKLLPGRGPLLPRYHAFKKEFIIPPDRLDAVFSAAIQEARRRTKAHLELPSNESFTVEYVTGKPWSAYNWYKGNSLSVIQVNTSLPVHIDRAVDLAAHEGYPGHHVYNALLEQHLVRERGWVEFSVYPLFSPQSLVAEGSANFGVDMVFPGEERVSFERDVLFPLAGMSRQRAGVYYDVLEQMKQLDYAGNEAGRRYLNGEIDAPQAAEWLGRFAMMLPDRAAQRVQFMDKYRSYIINYNLGEDLVR